MTSQICCKGAFNNEFVIQQISTSSLMGSMANCFTFNSGLNGSLTPKSLVAGPLYGLSMTLFVNQKQYIPGLGNQAGIRVLVHRQGELPNMDKGFNVPPGLRSSVALSYYEIERLKGEYYSNCTSGVEFTPHGNFSDFVIPGTYSLQGCYEMCIQLLTYKRCGCLNSLLTPVAGYNICMAESAGICAASVQFNMVYKEDCSCQLPCKEAKYRSTVSFSDWPSAVYEPSWTSYMKDRLSILIDDSGQNISSDHSIKNEFVDINIYFDSLEHHVFTERAAMTFEDLVGSIGGHLGLWIGMSVISFLEIFELIAGLFSVCGKFVYKKKKDKTIEKKAESEED
ncbi:hypothetical protein EB796_005763 [Bugula neritina]|uniref:SCNN1D n=1 Tax=Bugula neritina TaxID=10212 RepID=A0A7J7KCK3_BUGNE|nr:hypothetical protein EB796_005763 [Bugula neritina]